MKTVIDEYKASIKRNSEGDVMGVIRTLFPDITVDTFLEKKAKKVRAKHVKR